MDGWTIGQTKKFIIISESPATTALTFILNIGYTFGLFFGLTFFVFFQLIIKHDLFNFITFYLGMSCLSMFEPIELLAYIFSCLFERWKKKRVNFFKFFKIIKKRSNKVETKP